MYASITVPVLANERTKQAAGRLSLVGRWVALAGVVLPLGLIGLLKFTAIEIEALKPFIENTPWLAWLYALFGVAGASYFLGIVEITTALLLVASVRSPWTGAIGGAMASITFILTCSTMLTLPIWEAGSGGFPFLNAYGAFLIKDVALLGVSLVVLGTSLQELGTRSAKHRF